MIQKGNPSKPTVSVIVPIYNVADHVTGCIESLKAQTFGNFEVIAVDDGSTDESGAIAKKAAQTDDRFRFVQRENGGLSAARNTGLGLVRGDYVCFVDSDDRVAPDYLARMVETIESTGADWVACGVRFCYDDGSSLDHSAIHGAPKLDRSKGVWRQSLADWCDIVRLFPSAWNKIYRRSLLTGLMFDEGLYYEDHPFYYRCAERTDHIVILPEPLYWHTRGRKGQITAEGSDRVFQQFDVLRLMRGIIEDSDKSNGSDAFDSIATRLTFERSEALTDRGLRKRFLQESIRFLDGRVSGALGVAEAWMDLLHGKLPVSVIVPSDGNPGPLGDTLQSLLRQSLKEVEVLVVLDDAEAAKRKVILDLVAPYESVSLLAGNGHEGVAAARNHGLDAARGEAVVFLDAGDVLPPAALMGWHNRLYKAQAQVGFAPMIMLGEKESPHTGLHDKTGLGAGFDAEQGFVPHKRDGVYVHPHPSAKIFDRSFLVQSGLRFPQGPLSSWHMVIGAMAWADRAVYLAKPPARIAARPETRREWRKPVSVEQIVSALDAMRRAFGPDVIDANVAMRLFVRAAWEKINFADFPSDEAKTAFEADARRQVGVLDAPEAPLDAFVGARLRDILGLAGSPKH